MNPVGATVGATDEPAPARVTARNVNQTAFDLVPEDKIEGVLAWLKEKNMACSPYAAQYFMEALFQNESDDKALKLITADGDRSWKHMVDSGTTINCLKACRLKSSYQRRRSLRVCLLTDNPLLRHDRVIAG